MRDSSGPTYADRTFMVEATSGKPLWLNAEKACGKQKTEETDENTEHPQKNCTKQNKILMKYVEKCVWEACNVLSLPVRGPSECVR